MYVQIKVEPFCPSINYYDLDESRSGFDFGRVHDALIRSAVDRESRDARYCQSEGYIS
jgi:hypothetical protein